MNPKSYRMKLDHQIIQGNIFQELPKLPGHFFDLVITDPPFYVLNKTDIKFNHRTDIVQSASFDGFSSYTEFLSFTRRWLELVQTKMKPDSSIYIFFGAQYISDLYHMAMELGFKYKGIIIWHKTNPAPKIRKSGYVSSTELVLFLTQGNPTFNFLGQTAMHNFIETPLCMRPERLVDAEHEKNGKTPTLHPTQKPEKVISKFIKVSSNEDQWVLDPFTGTGTTNVVARKFSRKSVGIEINPKYVKAARLRLRNQTDQK